AREDRDRDGPAMGAAGPRTVVVATLPGGDGANDQPHHKDNRSDTHCYLRSGAPKRLEPCVPPCWHSATRTAPFKLAASRQKTCELFNAAKWLLNGLNNGPAKWIAPGACLDATPRAPSHRADQNHRRR